MYECFEKYLGIEGCNEDEPINGLYINGSKGLAGINLVSAGAIADEETQSGLNLLRGCRSSAIFETISDAKIELSRYFDFNKVIETFYNNPTQGFRYGDFYFQKFISTGYKYAKIECKEIKIISQGIETITIEIEEDEVVRTINANLIVGVNTITINANAFNSFELRTTTSVPIRYDGLTFFEGTIQLKCKDEAFWCAYAEELALAVRYKTGYLYMNEIVSSNRFNAEIQKEVAIGNMQLWYGGYNANNGRFEGGEYHKFLNSAIQTIKNSLVNDNDYCITCSQIKHLYARP